MAGAIANIEDVTKTLPKNDAGLAARCKVIFIDKPLVYQYDKLECAGIYTGPGVLNKQTLASYSYPMKNPADYLANRVFEARRPRRELQPVVAYADAVQAIEQALADAEKYKYLLMRALRHHADEVAATTPATAPDQTPVLPMYPAGLPLAA